MKRIVIKELNSLDAMEEIRRPWNELLVSGLNPTVFGSWEWQYLSAELFADQKPLILTAYDGDRLVAVLPLRRTRVKIGDIFSVTAWSCLGGGLTDYNALVVREEYLSSAITAFANYLTGKGYPVDLANVLPGSSLAMLGEYLANHKWRRAVYETKTALLTELPGDYDSFLKARKKKFRKTLRNNQNCMDRTGGYSYNFENASSELLDALIALHTSRWQYKGEEGALAQEKIKQFHDALQKMPGRPFEIQYYTIRHDNQIIAILYGFVMGGRFYAYLSGFDMIHNRISPGNMILNHCIEVLAGKGINVFDLLRGDMKYKQTWATISYDMKDGLYFPPTLSGRRDFLVMKTGQALKRIMPSSLKKKIKSVMHAGATGTVDDV